MNLALLRALLAAIPLFSLTLHAKNGFVYGIVGAAVLVLAVLIFFAVHAALPETVHRLSLTLLIVVLGVIAKEILSLSSLLLVSLSILPLPDVFRRRKKWRQVISKTFFSGFIFLALLASHGLLSEILGRRLEWNLFRLPAGSYLITGFALIFLRKK